MKNAAPRMTCPRRSRLLRPALEQLEDRTVPAGTIQGILWQDVDHDGVRDTEEAVLADRTVYLDLNASGAVDAGEPTQVTDASGAYAFAGLPGGTYRVAEVLESGWVQTSPRAATLTPGTAAPALWQSRGPFGGDAVEIAVSPNDPNFMIVALDSDYGGLWRSIDGGANWERLPGFFEQRTRGVAITTSGVIFAARSDGVFRSTDGGSSWINLEIDFETFHLTYSVTAHPTDPNTVYVGFGGFGGGLNKRLYKTLDGGATWTNVSPAGTSELTVETIAISPTNPQEVYLGFSGFTSGGGVFYSPDGGATWFDRRPGMPDGPLTGIAFDPAGNVYAAGGMQFGEHDFGLYRSSDHGATWTSLSTSWPNLLAESVAIDPNNPNIITVGTDQTGVFRSTDGGVTWEFGVDGTAGRQVNDLVHAGGTLFAATNAFAMLRSTDGGASFSPSSTGINDFDIRTASVNPNDPDEIAITFGEITSNTGGVLTTHDGGETWQSEPLPPTRFGLVKFAADGRLFAVSHGPTTLAQEALYRRNNDGSWTAIGPSFEPHSDTDVSAMTVHPGNPDLILAAGRPQFMSDDSDGKAAIWRTDDGGATWQRVYLNTNWGTNVSDITFLAGGATALATVQHLDQIPTLSTVMRSTDGGLTWTVSNTGLPTDRFAPHNLAPSRTDPNRVYLSAETRLQGIEYVSNDAGQTWSPLILADGIVVGMQGLVLDPSDEQIQYSQGPDVLRAVSRSFDGGLSYTPFDQGMTDGARWDLGVPALSVAGGSAPRLVASTRHGLYTTELLSTAATAHVVVLGEGETVGGVDFGARPLYAEISGFVFEDHDSDGEREFEFDRGFWTVYLDGNNNGRLDVGERNVSTTPWGYRFTGLEPGTYTIRIQPQEGWHFTAPLPDPVYTVMLGAGAVAADRNFGIHANPTEIRGTKWNDVNANGVRDPGEPALAGWTIYDDRNGNGRYDPSSGEPGAVTDAQGRYVLGNLQPGLHLIAEKPPLYWVQTSPGDGRSSYDPGYGSGPTAGDPVWPDKDPSTPNVIDIWYDFRNWEGYSNLITPGQMTAVELALTLWEQATAGRLHFTRNTSASQDDIITIGTGDLAPLGYESAWRGILGAGGSAVDGANLRYRGIAWMDYLDDWDEVYGNGDEDPWTQDYFTVAAHEVGHALGMDHTEHLPLLEWGRILMYPGYLGEIVTPSIIDVDQIRGLYGANTDQGLGFRVLRLKLGQIRDGLDFGSRRGVIPFNNFSLDFGTATSPVAPGYTRGTAATVYNPTVGGYGWLNGSGAVFDMDRGTTNPLTRDFVVTSDATFVTDAPDGSYDVTVTLGDPSKKRDQMEVYLEGTRVATVNTNSGQTSTQTFRVSVSDGQLTLRLRDAGGRDAQVAFVGLRVTRILPTLSVSLTPGTVNESAGPGASTGTITRTGDLSQSLVVTLSSGDTSEATVPPTVTIPVGQASATFAVSAVDDSDIDGHQAVVIAASANEYTGGSATLTVLDDDAPVFTAASLDFGTATSPVAAGFLQVTPAMTYSVTRGFGWASGVVTGVDRGSGGDLNRDFHSTTDGTFGVSVVNGTYSVTVTLGDATTAHDKMAVYLEGVKVDTITTAAGQVVRRTYQVSVNDGQLTLRLDDQGGRDPNAIINALEFSRQAGALMLFGGSPSTPSINRAAADAVLGLGKAASPSTPPALHPKSSTRSAPGSVSSATRTGNISRQSWEVLFHGGASPSRSPVQRLVSHVLDELARNHPRINQLMEKRR